MSRMKIIAGMPLVLGVISIALLAAPIQAYYNGIGDGDLLQTQDMDRLRTQGCECDCDMIHVQDHIRDRLQAQDCNCSRIPNSAEEQNLIRQRTNEYTTNRICNNVMSLEQYRYQHRNQSRERTKS